MRLEDLPGRACPIGAALETVGDRWSLLIVREVRLGSHRFTDIARGTGAPRDRLTARLKALVEAGILSREQYCESPPRHTYHLTEAGKELAPVLQALYGWGSRWACDPGPEATAGNAGRADAEGTAVTAPGSAPA